MKEMVPRKLYIYGSNQKKESNAICIYKGYNIIIDIYIFFYM